MIQIENQLSCEMSKIFSNPPYFQRENFTKMFEFIFKNKEFYLAYLKTNEDNFMSQTDFLNSQKTLKQKRGEHNYSEQELLYHTAFFSAGLTAMCKVWLFTGAKETPEQMSEILYKEYKNSTKHF